jgi:hypothetical protein
MMTLFPKNESIQKVTSRKGVVGLECFLTARSRVPVMYNHAAAFLEFRQICWDVAAVGAAVGQ